MEEKDSVPPTAYNAYLKQAQTLSLDTSAASEADTSLVKRAKFITPNDAVLETVGGDRLPAVPVEEAEKLNELEAKAHAPEKVQHGLGNLYKSGEDVNNKGRDKESTAHDNSISEKSPEHRKSDEPLGSLEPPRTTNPLFPPLPVYGPASFTRDVQCYIFRITSFFMGLTLLSIIFACGITTGVYGKLTSKEKDEDRPFYQEEINRQSTREAEEESWHKRKRRRASSVVQIDDREEEEAGKDSFVPTEGGKDPVVCDVAYYAKRVGLDLEEYKVQTEDGFIIDLWHIYNPKEYVPKSPEHRSSKGPNVFKSTSSHSASTLGGNSRKYPVLLIHGLLQSSGAFCTTDDHSLAFYLAKSNYDVWLGNNRCGFHPNHTLLPYKDPRMWNWNIRQMGVLDLPALISRVLHETGFSKLGLVGHSQGTTQTLVALAKTQRPDLGEKISVFCALAPAAYAGPLLNRWYFKFFRTLSPAMYKIFFGIHAFIPMMMTMHRILPSGFYGKAGYMVFSYLFQWSDRNWDRGLRDRCFQFAPVYISAEAMRWWLGRDCFSKQLCILATQDEWEMEDVSDDTYDAWALSTSISTSSSPNIADRKLAARKAKAWYDERSPPMAFWVAGNDSLVDGQRLLRRFSRERGREPCVRVVREKVVEGYEHLDVIWAVDSLEKVGREVKECIWETCEVRDEVVVPVGCEGVGRWADPGPVMGEG